ncbi:MAG: DinB family protein [Tepidisphaeraceae bacterium]
MDSESLVFALEFSRTRLLATLDAIEKSGQDVAKVLAWRPGPGRAHIAWQAMHCAATHDRYLNAGILQGSVKDQELVTHFAGGSTPSDANVPTLAVIRQKLAATYNPLKKFASEQTPQSLLRQVPAPGGKTRTVAESIVLLTWHEAHHQGQIHLTWNLYKAAHGVA